MDYLAHALWSYIIFHRTKKVKWAVVFGLLPDSLSWIIYFFYRLFTFNFEIGKPDQFILPKWMDFLYGISHSLIICGIVLLIVFVILKRVPVYMFAWPIAILVDIPTHTREFLPTPFLWPLSDWHFPGISWGNPWFMLVNYCAIIGMFVWIYYEKKNLANGL